MKILIVDDSAEKLRRVLDALLEVRGVSQDDIDVVYNARDARLRLTSTAYDLMILDIALPEWADVPPQPEVGISLLKEVSERPKYKHPKHIIGLTAYADIVAQSAREFEEGLWHLIHYDATATDWVQQLQRKLKYLVLLATDKDAAEYKCDLCIITALQVPEYAAVMNLPWKWQVVERQNEVAVFHSGEFHNSGHSRRVVAGCASRMGMTSAAIIATKAIYNFRPRFVALVGIAAGIRDQCNLGDIVIADPTWDYGSGKWSAKGSKSVFEMAPHQLPLNAIIRNRFQLLSQDAPTLGEIRNEWVGPKPDTALQLIVGPVGSGSTVRADGTAAKEVKAQHRKAVAIEMEAYGVMAAAHEAPLPEVKAFVVKSICDFADEAKTDEFQAYAAYTSASVLRRFAEAYLPCS